MVVMPDVDDLVNELQKWLKTQTHLPQGIEKILLKRFLYSMSNDLEGAKRLIELNYTLRNKYPQIFLNRDPTDESSEQLLQVADLVPLPGLTPQKNKLLFYRLIDYDADKFDFTTSIKVFFMMADCRFSVEDEAGMANGEVPIFDMAGFSLRHLTKVVFSSLRIYMKFVQEAHPVRLKEIHVLNCPSYLDKVLTVVKPFIKSEVFKLINFHLPDADTPYKFFPQDMLAEEYGGKAGKMTELKKHWVGILKEKREYMMDPNKWKIDKAKKSSGSSTFNSLDFD
ncbi:alpha-tocopherol transfer protein-like [Teleopsis dalmanni]|uniref:alpha-tocopherol transfer protein-like n=1 Tax=Teleopsis dalmanni TaxID=139649 RepID=UPI0018CCCF4C|nr:alpha-tocopherol transfer protein-like [Teleopsis dalmanni]